MSDSSKITSGPANVVAGGTDLGHTQGGTTIKVAPQHRMRVVDQFGASPVDIIHTGDDVRVTTNVAEYVIENLLEVFDPAFDGSGTASPYMGVGHTAGRIYSDSVLQVVPAATADADKGAEFHRASPVGEFELAFSHDADRVLKAEFVCLIDDSQTNEGELIGKLKAPSR